MSLPTPTNLTRAEAEKILRQFICIDRTIPLPEPAIVRAAVLLVADQSDYQILGICADTIAQAKQALHEYLAALSYTDLPEVPDRDGMIYLKYNAKTGRCHVDTYVGEHRGVLVSCQSAYDVDVNETFGHLPLDLFHPDP